MTETSARIIADHVSERGHRLTTVELTFWRPILAEINTHRDKSRSSASSRAIPVEKSLTEVFNDPSLPVAWPCEQPGMQGGSDLQGEDLELAQRVWDDLRKRNANMVEDYINHQKIKFPGEDENGVANWKHHTLHKSILNRALEAWKWHTCIMSGTNWENMLNQRSLLRTNLAQPEFGVLAQKLEEVMEASIPTFLNVGEWHTPYFGDQGGHESDHEDLANHFNLRDVQLHTQGTKEVSTARCARVSYLNQNGERDIKLDLDLFQKLKHPVGPPHFAPSENIATPCTCEAQGREHRGNFVGWDQFRHELEDEMGWNSRA